MRPHRRALALAVAIAAAVAVAAAAPAAALAAHQGAARRPASGPVLPLAHAGRWITDARGRVVEMHGINMVDKLAPYDPAATGFGDDDAAFLRRIGLNAVRVGVIWKAVEPQPGVYDDAYLGRIADTVRTLAAHGIVSLIDFHQDMYNERFQGEGAPDWAVQDDGLPAVPKLGFPANYETMPALQHTFDHFWENSPGPGGVGLQDRYAAAWRHVALRLRSTAGVLGYDLFNEPFPGTPWATCAGSAGCPAFDAKLTAFDARVDRAIRTVDPRTLIFYEPNVVFDFGFVTNVGALGDPRAVFSWHDYCLTNEAQGCSSHATVFANAERHVAMTGEGTMMTEFGATNSASDLRSMVALADQNRTPWLEWAYCGCGDPTTAGPGNTQAIVIDPAKPPEGSNLEPGTLDALVEPYPQVVAGTPSAWAFDPASATFHLSYRRGRAGGHGSFRRGAETDIATPTHVYGGHYTVRVDGGTVVSRPGSSELRIVSCRGRAPISVSVAPAGRGHVGCKAPGRRHHRRHRRRSR
jgi:endoglycosylceramidase